MDMDIDPSQPSQYAGAGTDQAAPQHQTHSPAYDARPQTSYSDTGFRPYSSASEAQPPSAFPSISPAPDAQPQLASNPPYAQGSQPPSRPASGLSGAHPQSTSGTQGGKPGDKEPNVVIKVGMVGDAQIGKTSLMVKYVEGSWDEDYIQTLGVNFMEKTISIRGTEITFSIWDLGGQREFVNMLPLVCNDAVAILFMFDLTRKSTLNSIKEWYRQGRGFNKTAIPFLVGTKYDHFVNFPREEQEEISTQARRFAKAMKASLIFSSTSHSINVQKVIASSPSAIRIAPLSRSALTMGAYRFSRLSSQKPLTYAAPFPRLSTSASRCYYTRPSARRTRPGTRARTSTSTSRTEDCAVCARQCWLRWRKKAQTRAPRWADADANHETTTIQTAAAEAPKHEDTRHTGGRLGANR